MSDSTCGECPFADPTTATVNHVRCPVRPPGICRENNPACAPVVALMEARAEVEDLRDLLKGYQELLNMALDMNKSGQRREEIMRRLREKGIEV